MKTIISEKIFDIKALERAEYIECTFTNCDLSDLNLSNYSFKECEFTECNLSNIQVEHTSFKEVFFDSCKLIGIQFELCNPFLLKLGFERSLLDYSSFYQLTLTKTNFKGCSLIEVDFSQAILTQSIFDHCNLSLSKFENTNLEKVNFVTSVNYSINPSKNNIKKASFSKDELAGLLTDFDIVISQ